MNSIILSVRPEYVVNILDGTKKYEYRKRLATSDVKYIYIYCTSPIMKVVARVRVDNVLQASPTVLWEQTKKAAGITRQGYRQYFKGCKIAFAYQLGDLQIYDIPKNLQDFGVAIAPQSFVYINEPIIRKKDFSDNIHLHME